MLITLGAHCAFLFAGDAILQLWLGNQFSPPMAELLRILSLGIAFNALSQVTYLLLVIGRRERAAAIVQFISLPTTAVASLVAAHFFGALGVAWTFTLRLLIDSFLVKHIAARAEKDLRGGLPYSITLGWIAITVGLYLAA